MSEGTYPQTGADLIAAERVRQIEQEGYDEQHDVAHGPGPLLDAASEYLSVGSYRIRYPDSEHDPAMYLDIKDMHGFPASNWPWAPHEFKPTADPIPNLVKAGALIAAEIDRLMAQES
jgi:hypothetical protein